VRKAPACARVEAGRNGRSDGTGGIVRVCIRTLPGPWPALLGPQWVQGPSLGGGAQSLHQAPGSLADLPGGRVAGVSGDSERKAIKALWKVGAGAALGGPVGAFAAAVGEVIDFLSEAPRLEGAEEARDELIRETFLEHARRFSRLLEAHAADVEARTFNAEELVAIVRQLQEEARRAVTEERARMLAAASAGAFRPDLDVETKSRVMRALLELEPSDVASLREIATSPEVTPAEGLFLDGHRVWRYPHRYLYDARDVIDRLRGCVTVEQKAYTAATHHKPPRLQVRVTTLGRALLAFLETYRPEEGAAHP